MHRSRFLAALLGAVLLLTLLPLPTASADHAADWENIVSVEAGYRFVVGLKADGTVVLEDFLEKREHPLDVSGWTEVTELVVPSQAGLIFGLRSGGSGLATGIESVAARVSGWTEIEQLVVSSCAAAGLRRDGTVCGVYFFGDDDEIAVPYFDGLKGIIRLFPGPNDIYAQDLAGELYDCGSLRFGKDLVELAYNAGVLLCRYADGTAQLDIPGGSCDYGEGRCVKEWSGLTQVAATDWLYAGLRSDGRVVACNLYSPLPAVDSWRDIKQIRAVFGGFLLGLHADGRLSVAAQDEISSAAFSARVASWENIRALHVGYECLAALFADGTVKTVSPYRDTQPFDTSGWSNVTSLCSSVDLLVGLRADGTVLVAHNPLYS